MIDARQIINKITDNESYIEQIICELGYENLKRTGDTYRFSNFGSMERNICLWKDDLRFVNFSRATKGNIITLVMETNHCKFPEALRWIVHLLDLKINNRVVRLPYDGFYKDIIKSNTDEDIAQIKTYDKSQLPQRGGLSEMFFRDGVSYQVQNEFGVCVDLDSNKIIIPVESHNGLIGAKWRANDKEADQRYGMYLAYPKSQVLFGMNRNYATIQQKDALMLVEAEKGVMQAATFGVGNILACAGHQLSKTQIRLIQSLRVGTIIVGFDESIDPEEIEWQCNQLKSIFDTRIGFIYDKNNDILKKNSKDSPTDNGLKIFKKLLRDCIIWI